MCIRVRIIVGAKAYKIFLKSRQEIEKSDNEYLDFYSSCRTNKLVEAVVVTVTTLLLVAPAVVPFLLTVHHASGGIKIGVLLLFVVAFAVALSTLKTSTRAEMFGASAACVA